MILTGVVAWKVGGSDMCDCFCIDTNDLLFD